MNKRIKELAERSGFILFSPEEDPYTPIDWSCDYTEELEVFAESIVRECTSQIAMLGITNYDNEDISWATSKAIEIIKYHFGIKQ